MSTRVTQADIHRAFERAVGSRAAADIGANPERTEPGYDNRHNIGKLALDYAPVYGGWVIIEYVGGSSDMGSAESCPFGYTRRAGRQMLDFLNALSMRVDL